MSGITSVALTKLDVLNDFDTIKVAVGYTAEGRKINSFPASIALCEKIEPEYAELKGWKCDIAKIRKYDDLPHEAKEYISFIEQKLGVPVSIISVGPGRDETIVRKEYISLF